MAEFINTVDVIGDDALTDSIIYRNTTEYNDNSILIVGNSTFSGCSVLTSVNFPLVTNIANNAFQGCSKLTSADCPSATQIGQNSFENCSKLTSADFPLVTSIGMGAFEGCTSLTSVNFPLVTSIASTTFYGCSKLTSADFPLVTSIASSAFRSCSELTSADFPLVTSIDTGVFYSCYSLTAVILRSDTVCTLANTNAFEYCYHILGTTIYAYNPTGAKDGYIYVPRALVDSYKSATNWSTYASQFRALEDYTVDGTTTGELDPNKI